jgi:gamma-glutamyltranspeptidase/glutathione hydrolase
MMPNFHSISCLLTVALLLLCGCSNYNEKAIQPFEKGAVVSAHALASEVGVDILQKGGNAMDAAVAVHFALAVVYPNAGNIGGGGFMLYRGVNGEVSALDFRETAPKLAHKELFLDEKGEPIPGLSLQSTLSSGIPGSVAGMEAAHARYGSLDWKDLLTPAIRLAEEGFPLTQRQANELNDLKKTFEERNDWAMPLLHDSLWQKGDLLVQHQLARTLRAIQTHQSAGFYSGFVADALVETMRKTGGIMDAKDLLNYTALWRTPIEGRYRGYTIYSMPPPSSGGICLINLLKSVEPFPLSKWGFQSDSSIRVMVEASRRVYADRATYMGDPDFVEVPQQQLLDSFYMASRMEDMRFDRATPSNEIQAGSLLYPESEETTHFSIIDAEGNAVSITTTINESYGSKIMVEGAGFLLNNEMDDFSIKPGVPNLYGLLGGDANAIEPQKRMLSAMTPTLVVQDGKTVMVVGTPGGSTIITSVFQTLVNVIDFGMSMQKAIDAPKFHHQWMPDVIQHEESAIQPQVREQLQQSGYLLQQRAPIGRVDAIWIDQKGMKHTGADPRGDDAARGY